MKLNSIQTRIADAIEADVPVFVVGSPGVGKSAMILQVADMLFPNPIPYRQRHGAAQTTFIDMRLSMRESVDLRGIPVPDHERRTTVWYACDELPFEGSDYPEAGLIVFEELNACAVSVQVASYQVILDRMLGERRLKAGWRVVATGNKLTDNAAATKISSALANRFCWFDYEADKDEFCDWAAPRGIDPGIIGFIQYRSELLFKMAAGAREFPTPRTWEMASRFMRLPKARRLPMIAGCVGAGPAAELEAFLDIVGELDSVETILKNPDKARVPDKSKVAALYGVTVAVAMAVDKKTARNGAIYVRRLSREFQALFAKLVLTRDPQLALYGFADLIAGEKV